MPEPLVAPYSPPSPPSISDEIAMDSDILEQPTRNTDPQGSSQALVLLPDPTPAVKSRPTPCGCAYLQTIYCQFEDYSTTNGSYLDAIFTHREVFYSYPAAHLECAAAFNDLAYMLEKRAWRADREADMEAVVAFRHESWTIANML